MVLLGGHKSFVILSLITLFSLVPLQFLSADSYLYLRLARNLQEGGSFSDGVNYFSQTGGFVSADGLRSFPEGVISGFYSLSYLLYVYDWPYRHSGLFDEKTLWYHTAQSFTVVMQFVNALLVAGIILLLTSHRLAGTVGFLLYVTSPAVKLVTTFDTQVLRTFYLLMSVLLVVVFLKLKTKSQNEFWFKLFTIAGFLFLIKNYLGNIFSSIIRLDSYNFVTELQAPTLTEFFVALPGILFLLFTVSCVYLSFKLKKQWVKDSTNWISCYGILCLSVVFFALGLSMKRFMPFFVVLAIIFDVVVWSLNFKNRNLEKSWGVVFKENFGLTIFVVLLVVSGLFFHPQNTFWKYAHDSDTVEAVKFLRTQNAYLVTGWDTGYFYQYESRIPTLTDGGLFTTANNVLAMDVITGPEGRAKDLLLAVKTSKSPLVLLDKKTRTLSNALAQFNSHKLWDRNSLSRIALEGVDSVYFLKVFESTNHDISIWGLKPQ